MRTLARLAPLLCALVLALPAAAHASGAMTTGIADDRAVLQEPSDERAAATLAEWTALGIDEASNALGISGLATATFGSETVDATAVLVKYTYGGDANVDGKINVDDYGRIDFNVALQTTAWANGDFNYDGKINVDDYGIIDFNVAAQGPPL